MDLDDLGRPVIPDQMKAQITDAFKGVKGRGALVILATDQGTRGHVAAKLGDHWKVAAGGGMNWADKKPSGFVGIEATW